MNEETLNKIYEYGNMISAYADYTWKEYLEEVNNCVSLYGESEVKSFIDFIVDFDIDDFKGYPCRHRIVKSFLGLI